MALKALMLRKKLNDAQKALEELRAKSEDFATREAEKWRSEMLTRLKGAK